MAVRYEAYTTALSSACGATFTASTSRIQRGNSDSDSDSDSDSNK